MKPLEKQIVDVLLSDLSDRSGLGDEYDILPDSIKREIKNKWMSLIKPLIAENIKNRIPALD